MSEIIICPVCERQIPANFLCCCFYCGFDLEKLDDDKSIKKAKDIFDGYKIWSEKDCRPLMNVLASVVLGLLIIFISLHACSFVA